MLTDYKISRLTRSEKGDQCLVRFYEGNITTENEESRNKIIPVTRYRRTRKVREQLYDITGKNDGEVRTMLNIELAKDTTRIPIDNQKVSLADL